MSVLGEGSIALVGGGVMAEAVMRGLLGKALVRPGQITASDPVAERREHLAAQLGIRVAPHNEEVVREAHIAILAVKPQVLARVLDELAGKVEPEALVLSLVAGATIGRIRQGLGHHAAVVRFMPNTPAQVGEGISVWTATAETSPEQRAQAQQIIAALGEEVYVETEDYLDMATALSGSGPAYVFLFLEALIDAGVHLGFARPVAQKLALQTMRGSALFAQKTGLHPALLRNMVTSPGGTTAEGLHELEEGKLRATVSRAVWAAYRRAKSLGSLDSK